MTNLSTLEELCTHSTPPADFLPPGLKWERDLDHQFNITTRNRILRFTHKFSICAKTQETNYKIISRWYRTLVVLRKLFPTTSELCWRCQSDKGALVHIFWSCPRITHFWQVVRGIVQKFTDRTVPDDPAFFLLHASSIPERTYKKSMIRHLLDAAKASIPFHWKSLHPPSFGMWVTKVEKIKKNGGPQPHSSKQAGDIFQNMATIEHIHIFRRRPDPERRYPSTSIINAIVPLN